MKLGPLFFISAILLLTALLFFEGGYPTKPTDARDEKAAGLELLAKKLTGPTYFHQVDSPLSKAGYLTPAEASQQVPSIVGSRHWDTVKASEIQVLIVQLSEPPPYRWFGSPQVNIIRLNLALDALR